MSTASERVASSSESVEFAKPKEANSLWSDAFKRLRRNKLAISSLVFIVLLGLLAIFAPLVSPYSYSEQNYDAIRQSPNWEHPLGTDQLGRDILSRLLFGARISLSVGIIVQVVIVLIGVPAGIVAGYYGGKIDTFIMRLVDILYAMPSLLFVIIIMTFLQGVLDNAESGFVYTLATANSRLGGLVGVFIGLGLISWLTVARIVRAQSMSLKNKEFVEAARSIGATNRQVMTRHILSNTMAPIIVAVTLGIPLAIIYESGISFLGLGVRPPMPSWGLMISEAIPNLRSYPYMLLAPAGALSLTVLAFNFLGDGIRDAFDPWMKK
ncbi:MAG: ABC transporter permease [Thermomicrobiales bacterium]